VLLVLDEIAEADSKTIKRVVYQLAHGAGRGRQNSNAEMKERRHWRTLVVSTGEQSLGSMIERDGGEISGGLAVRFLELPVASSGMLQRLDDAADVKRLEVAVGQVYGTAGPAFVEWLIARGFGELEHAAILAARQRLDAIEGALLGDVVDPRHRRAGRAFALLQLAGELAIDAGVAPAELDPAGTAALAFKAWLGAAGRDETDDLRAIARKVRDFIVRELDVSISPSGVEPKRTRSGWYSKKSRIGGDDDEGDEITVWLLSGALKAQLNGLPAREWCREAIRRGVLIPGEGERNLTRRVPKALAPGRPRAHEFILAELEVWAESDEPVADDAPVPF
jgi:GNAT superfamily N-acetyltransferase